MRCKLLLAQASEFTNKQTGELVRGINLVFFNETTGEATKLFVGNDNLKGFDPKQVSQIKGKDLEISTTVKTFNGRSRVVLEKITEVP